MREVSHDLTLRRPLELADGTHGHRARRAVGVLRPRQEVRARARARASVGEEVGAESHGGGSAVLAALETDPMSLADQLDWVAKYRLLRRATASATGSRWNDARLRAMDLQYHDLRPEKSLFARVGMRAPGRRRRGRGGDDRAARAPRGPISGASACRSGVPTSWPRTGIHWCSTSGLIPCGGCR